MHASPDMRKTAPSAKTQAARMSPTPSSTEGLALIMAQPAPATITMPAEELRALMEEANVLAARFGLLLQARGVDIAPPTVLPGNVHRLADYRPRARRQAASR